MDFRSMMSGFGRGGALMAAVAGGVLLTACSTKPTHPEAAAVEKVNQVEWRVETHPVQFGLGTAEPRPGEIERLSRFLSSYDRASGAHVFIDAGANVAGAELSRQRIERLRGVLAARGTALQSLPTDPAGRSPMDSDPRVLSVHLGEYVVVPPVCPDTRKATSSDFTNTHTSNYGCSTTAHLGLMVANPGDLVHGRDPGAADAERAVLGHQRYREPPKRKDGSAAIDTVATTGATQ